jgi:A/G-specific adenine glycosylase
MLKNTAADFNKALQKWFRVHGRVLPWRSNPLPYAVLVSEFMLQQTTVTAVQPYFQRWMKRFPDVASLAAAPEVDVMKHWEGLGYYSRARNLHACAKAVAVSHGGRFPETEDGLRGLPGIGAYTAAAVAAIAFDRRAVVVDGNVERVITRLFVVDEPLPKAKPAIRALADRLTPETRPGDFAQAMMDLGATLCTPRSPACGLCPWRSPCQARAQGTAETYPRKTAKVTGALRRGAAFVAVRTDGAVLLRTRPPKGLLGGMAEVPTTAWSASHRQMDERDQAPLAADWRRLPGAVMHVFTHFPLELSVWLARVPAATPAPDGHRWTAAAGLAGEALPTVMRKVVERGLLEL